MKQKIFNILNELKINFENFEHNPVFTCDEAKWIEVPWKRVKSLLLRNEKKTNIYMVVLEDEKRINTNELRKILWEYKLSFAPEDLMIEKIWVKPGHVSPFALINNSEKDIKVIFDRELRWELIWFHPWQNDNTTVLNLSDVEKFLSHIWFTFEYLEL